MLDNQAYGRQTERLDKAVVEQDVHCVDKVVSREFVGVEHLDDLVGDRVDVGSAESV